MHACMNSLSLCKHSSLLSNALHKVLKPDGLLCGKQGTSTHQTWMNISDLTRPLFQGVPGPSPDFVCRIDSKVHMHISSRV